MKILLSFDTDWAPEDSIKYVMDILIENKLFSTFFATNYYDSLSNYSKYIDIGLHPNFNDILSGGNKSFKERIDSLLSIYPKAKGFRSHSLTTSSSILDYCFKSGLVYDSNIYNPNGGKAYKDYSGLIRYTHSFVDYGLILEKKNFNIKNIGLRNDKLNILDFHPIHIFLNTPSESFYQKIKAVQKSNISFNIRNTKKRGVGDLFEDLVSFIKINKIETVNFTKLNKSE